MKKVENYNFQFNIKYWNCFWRAYFYFADGLLFLSNSFSHRSGEGEILMGSFLCWKMLEHLIKKSAQREVISRNPSCVFTACTIFKGKWLPLMISMRSLRTLLRKEKKKKKNNFGKWERERERERERIKCKREMRKEINEKFKDIPIKEKGKRFRRQREGKATVSETERG